MAELSAVPDTRREALQGHAAMLLFSAAIAGSFSLGARAANLIDPAAISAARFAIAAGVIGGIVMAGPGIQRAAFRAPWRYLVLGGLFAAYFVLSPGPSTGGCILSSRRTRPVTVAQPSFSLSRRRWV